MDIEEFLYDISCDYGYDYDSLCSRYLKGVNIRSQCCVMTAKGTVCKLSCNSGATRCHVHGGPKSDEDNMFYVTITLEELIDKICRIHKLNRNLLRKRYISKIYDREEEPITVVNNDNSVIIDDAWINAEEERLAEYS